VVELAKVLFCETHFSGISKQNWYALNLLRTNTIVPCFLAHCVKWPCWVDHWAGCPREVSASAQIIGNFLGEFPCRARLYGAAMVMRSRRVAVWSWALRDTGDTYVRHGKHVCMWDAHIRETLTGDTHIYGKHLWETRGLPDAKSWRWFLSLTVIWSGGGGKVINRTRWLLSKGSIEYTLTSGEIHWLWSNVCGTFVEETISKRTMLIRGSIAERWAVLFDSLATSDFLLDFCSLLLPTFFYLLRYCLLSAFCRLREMNLMTMDNSVLQASLKIYLKSLTLTWNP